MMTHTDVEIIQNRPISNAKLGVLVLLGAETMLFVGLIGAFLVFRMGNVNWQPPLSLGDIQLPQLVTGINTFLLLFSGLTMFFSVRSIQQDKIWHHHVSLVITWYLGLAFLVIQGTEWVQLISQGLTLQSGIYGGIFYVLIGCHALHVLGAVMWLSIVLAKSLLGSFSSQKYTGVETCMLYWTFVVALWLILYILVYLY